MRRVLGFVLATLGVALLVLGVLSPTVLYPKLATVPLDQQSTSVSEGSGMSALQPTAEKINVLTNVTLRSTRKVQGIPGRVKDHDGQAFWQTGVTSEAVGIGQLSFSDEGVSFDRKTGMSTNCCGDFASLGTIDEPSKVGPITHEGLFFKFPFNVEKKSYPFWDGDLNRAEDIAYRGTDKIDGLAVYKFEQKLGPETLSQQAGLPGDLFGTDHPVDADLVYENTRTLWVEPNTGVIIKGVEQQNKRFEADGLPAVPVTVGTIGYTDANVKQNVDDWATKATLLNALQLTIPLVTIVLGLILLGLGLVLLLRTPRRNSSNGGAKHSEPVTSGV
jgi:hypothetical protein